MRKPVLPRFLLLLAAYLILFGVIVHFQFSRRDDFTMRSGAVVVRGRLLKTARYQLPNTYPLSGAAAVYFGGMEFDVEDALLMTLADNGAWFQLNSGHELSFITQYSGGAIELVINAEPDSGPRGGQAAVLVPYRPLPTSVISAGGASFMLGAGGSNYRFSTPLASRGTLSLRPENAVSYRAVPDRQTVNARDFLLAQAADSEQYRAAFAAWLDQSYSGWNRAVSAAAPQSLSPELVCAYLSEALKRGTYKPSAAAVTAVYTPESYEASAYIGKLDVRTLAAAERERSARLSRIFNERAMDFLRENRIISFLAVRGYNNLLDDAAALLRVFDPAVMTVEQSAGILEGRADWQTFRPGAVNPFDRLIDQAFFVVTDNLRKNPYTGAALVFTGNEADAELNLRVGGVLSRYEDETTAALGRTLILSVLSFSGINGAVPRRITVNTDASFNPSGEMISSAGVYRLCAAGPNYARSQELVSGASWAWTAATELGALVDGGVLDIAVTFPAGETHYMLIRGIRPFTTLQLHGTNYPPDSQFERYDNSGWVYSGSEQTLMVKLRHRTQVEHIRIQY